VEVDKKDAITSHCQDAGLHSAAPAEQRRFQSGSHSLKAHVGKLRIGANKGDNLKI